MIFAAQLFTEISRKEQDPAPAEPSRTATENAAESIIKQVLLDMLLNAVYAMTEKFGDGFAGRAESVSPPGGPAMASSCGWRIPVAATERVIELPLSSG